MTCSLHDFCEFIKNKTKHPSISYFNNYSYIRPKKSFYWPFPTDPIFENLEKSFSPKKKKKKKKKDDLKGQLAIETF